MAGDFRLSTTLKGHDEDVRAIVFPTRQLLFSASRDNTARQWSLQSSQPPIYDDTIAIQGQNWFNGLAYSPSSKEHPKGLIATGGRETFVYIKEVGASPDADPYRLLIGHAGNISCMAFSEDGRKIISGAWDSQVFVWDVESGAVAAELTGHEGPVWGIMVYDAKLIVTACADKMIRIFDISGKPLHTIQGHSDVVRSFCKLPSSHWSGAAFASAGNDEIIRLWTLDGVQVAELDGHTAYIYDLAILPNGDIVSSSEDRTVRIWRDGQCVQTITHPAISIWTVAVCPETGDIASGASDKTIRIFSRDPERQADAETVASFEESNRMYAIPAETASQGQPFQKENLPGPEALQTQVGQRDGQQLFIRENDGSVTAHLWAASTGQWNLIGTVVEGEGTGTSKKTHEGKEYDYVFDIDIEDGKPPLKLPYNLTESSWDAARRFLERNELPLSYYEQVANWITENTQGARIGQGSGQDNQSAPPQGHDPWGTERRYRPGDAPSFNAPRKLPQRSYIGIVEGNPTNAINIISQKNEAGELLPEQSLQPQEMAALNALPTQLQNKQDPKPTSDQINALLKVASHGPTKSRVPAVGVLAVLAVSPDFVSATSVSGKTIIDIIAAAGLLHTRQETPNNVVHTLRLLVNLFKNAPGTKAVHENFEQVLQLARPFASEPESPAQVKALATLYLNYAVLLSSTTLATDREARAKVLVTDIAVLLESDSPHASDSDALYRTLSALGTLLSVSDAFKNSLKGGISGTLHFATAKAAAQLPNTKELIQEIRDALR